MIRLTKIFHFETAHAIHGYIGACKNVHGHSYELHVTVAAPNSETTFIPAPGFLIDFKDIKRIVKAAIVEKFDHKLILSSSFVKENPSFVSQDNLLIWEAEPTAENILLYVVQVMQKELPDSIRLAHLKLYETKDSYAEWIYSS